MTEQAVREIPKNPQPAGSDNTAGNNSLQAGGSNFDYIESMKEMGNTAWNAAKDFVNNPEVQSAIGAVTQNADVQKMILGFALSDGAGGAAAADGATAGSGAPAEKINIDTDGKAIYVPDAYKPLFDAFSQIDSNPADGLTQEDLLKMGSDPRLNSHAQVMAEAWGRKENFDRLAAYDGDATTLSAEDINQAVESKNLDLVAEIGGRAGKALKAADAREKVGLPRDASDEDYMKELERRGLNAYADRIATSLKALLTDETDAPEENMKAALTEALAAGIPATELAKVVNSKLDPALEAEMEAREVKNGRISGGLHIKDGLLTAGFPFQIDSDGTLTMIGRYR